MIRLNQIYYRGNSRIIFFFKLLRESNSYNSRNLKYQVQLIRAFSFPLNLQWLYRSSSLKEKLIKSWVVFCHIEGYFEDVICSLTRDFDKRGAPCYTTYIEWVVSFRQI